MVRQISSALGARLVGRQVGVAVEVGGGIAERRLAQAHEAGDVPVLDHAGVGVHVDREVEEVRDERDGLAALGHARRLQHVEAFDDQDVGAIDDGRLAGMMS